MRSFLNAVQFLTRVPVRSPGKLDEDWLLRAAKFFPLVGVFVGCVSALIFVLTGMVWSGIVPALLATTASIALTGALHEDGLSDTADGLGGGTTLASRLAIMKDSRIGVYGVLAVGLGIALRVGALATLAEPVGAAALIACHTAARFPPMIALRTLDHIGDPASAKVSYLGQPIRAGEIAFGAVIVLAGLLPLLAFSALAGVVGLALGALLVIWLCRLARRLVGGYTGDILGAVEQVFEIGFMLGVAAVLG